MKDLKYSLIDTVSNAKKEMKELVSLLKFIERNLRRGSSNLTAIITSQSAIQYLEYIGFNIEYDCTYYTLFGKNQKNYKITIKEKFDDPLRETHGGAGGS